MKALIFFLAAGFIALSIWADLTSQVSSPAMTRVQVKIKYALCPDGFYNMEGIWCMANAKRSYKPVLSISSMSCPPNSRMVLKTVFVSQPITYAVEQIKKYANQEVKIDSSTRAAYCVELCPKGYQLSKDSENFQSELGLKKEVTGYCDPA